MTVPPFNYVLALGPNELEVLVVDTRREAVRHRLEGDLAIASPDMLEHCNAVKSVRDFFPGSRIVEIRKARNDQG